MGRHRVGSLRRLFGHAAVEKAGTDEVRPLGV